MNLNNQGTSWNDRFKPLMDDYNMERLKQNRIPWTFEVHACAGSFEAQSVVIDPLPNLICSILLHSYIE